MAGVNEGRYEEDTNDLLALAVPGVCGTSRPEFRA
jgi:hypothetical protein